MKTGEHIKRKLRRLRRQAERLSALRELLLGLAASGAQVCVLIGCEGSVAEISRDIDTRLAGAEQRIRELLMQAAGDDDL